MVLDGFEEKEKENLKIKWEAKGRGAISGNALWERQDQWGNDGLVTVQSARWGEFLGILEGCDHWEMRGARGLELDFDIPLGIGIGNSGSDKGEGWGFTDWGKFVGAWKKQEQRERMENRREEMKVRTNISGVTQTSHERDRDQKRQQDDEVIKSSTDKLSAVFDWLVEQVPSPPNLMSKDKSNTHAEMKQAKKTPAKHELATKMNLERFYVAMSRKLYDEGL